MTAPLSQPAEIVAASLLPQAFWRIMNAPVSAEPERDVSDPATEEGWIVCGDGRTLMEYAKGDPR